MRVNWKMLLVSLLIIGLLVGLGTRCGSSSYDAHQPQVKLYLNKEQKIIDLPLEEYLVGVVGAEMPASFGNEALMAQAVTARTYTLKKLYALSKHPHGAQMCDDIQCCQAYLNPQNYQRQFGKKLYQQRFVPVAQAVASTRGQVMLYHNELINTPYFSTCGGQTASSEEVWGQPIPYLKSVKCPYCRESKRFNNEIRLSLPQVNKVLKQAKNQKFKFTRKVVSTSGRLRWAVVDGKEIGGQQLRELFQLPSTQIISAKQTGMQVTFSCRGYGHGVGLCQYGAAGMGQRGYGYQEILLHYYPGTNLTRLKY